MGHHMSQDSINNSQLNDSIVTKNKNEETPNVILKYMVSQKDGEQKKE